MTGDAERIKKIVESDAVGAIKNTLAVAQSDVDRVLCEFMDIEKLVMHTDRVGEMYKVVIEVDASRIYDVGKVSIIE